MTHDFKQAYAGDQQYRARGDGKPGAKVWIVVAQHPNGTPDTASRVAAYFREDLARAHGAKLLGVDSRMVRLESIEVLDLPETAR